jgi:hypothetical protein
MSSNIEQASVEVEAVSEPQKRLLFRQSRLPKWRIETASTYFAREDSVKSAWPSSTRFSGTFQNPRPEVDLWGKAKAVAVSGLVEMWPPAGQ